MEVVPLYFQYKLPDFTSRPAQSQPRAEGVRRKFGFSDENGLFHFKLRKKAAKEPRSQHELMLEMDRQGHAIFYVATTFIDIDRLRFGGRLHKGRRPWIPREHSFGHEGDEVFEYVAPWFDGLICIPPFSEVTLPVEKHSFMFNQSLEVSLHSEPMQAQAVPLIEVISHLSNDFGGEASVNEKNVSEYIDKVLIAVAGGEADEESLLEVKQYYKSLITGSDIYRASLMGRLRPMAQLIKALTGIDVFFAARRGRRQNPFK